MTYWLDLFTGTTWTEFQNAGSKVTGFRESRWNRVKKIKKGDRLLCYLTGVSRFVGVLEATGAAFRDDSCIWKDQIFPSRLPVKPIVALDPKFGVPVRDLSDSLSCFTDATTPSGWTGKFRGSLSRWSKADGEAVYEALITAKNHPRELPTDPRKLAKKPPAYVAKDKKPVTIPDDDEIEPDDKAAALPTAHTEIQFLLLRLGADMGYDVWVAKNDRSKQFNGISLAKSPRIKDALPLQFDEATNRTIELIDVLWLKGNTIIAAFEVESTTSVYSGLLRMSDLSAMQPNLNIPLYLVAPDERRNKVFSEVNRPTFSHLQRPLSEICRFIAFSELKNKVSEIGSLVRFLKPEFLEELSESCSLEEDE